MGEIYLKDERSNRAAGERGFSLIEVMIAIGVLTFGLVSLVGISAYISRSNSTSNGVSVLAATAQDQIDLLRSAIWTVNSDNDPRLAVGGDLDSDVDDHSDLRTDTPIGDIIIRWKVVAGPGNTGDARTVTIKVVQDNPPRNLRDGYTISTVINRN